MGNAYQIYKRYYDDPRFKHLHAKLRMGDGTTIYGSDYTLRYVVDTISRLHRSNRTITLDIMVEGTVPEGTLLGKHTLKTGEILEVVINPDRIIIGASLVGSRRRGLQHKSQGKMIFITNFIDPSYEFERTKRERK